MAMMTQVTKGVAATTSVMRKTTPVRDATEGIEETSTKMTEVVDSAVHMARITTERDPLTVIGMGTQRQTKVPTSDKKSTEQATSRGSRRSTRALPDENTVNVITWTTAPDQISAQDPTKVSTAISLVEVVAATVTEIAAVASATEVDAVVTVTEVAVVATAATATEVAAAATVTEGDVVVTQLEELQGRWSSPRAHTTCRSLQICTK